MYFIVSWDISAVNPRWSAIDEQMRNCFKGYTQLRPVNTFYMVKVASGNERNAILTALQAVAQQTSEDVFFVMSPVLTVSGWDGWLPQDKWELVKAITG
jgi:hypothetical protein